MKKISIFFMALMVSAMTMAATFTKVKSAPTDWSGEYILVYEAKTDTGMVFTEEADAAKNSIRTVIASGAITGTFNTLVIAKMEGGYSLQVKGGDKNGKYLAGKSGDNKMYFDDNATAATIVYDDNSVKITSNTSVMRFNKAAGSLWFRFFKATTYTSQQAVQLYKLKKQTAPTVVDSIGLKNNGKDTVEVGDKLDLNSRYTIFPDTATDQRVEFSIIEGATYVSINEGVITGLAEGDAQIKITAIDSLNTSSKKSAIFQIHVKAAAFNTCADVNAAAKDDKLKLNPVTVVYVNGSNNYVKDDSGSTLVYQQASGLKAGDIVSGIKGVAAPFNGLPELKPTNATTDWTVTAGVAPAIPEAAAAPTAAEVNQVLEWKGVTNMSGEFTSASITNITGKYGTEDIIFRNNFKFAQSFDDTHSYDITGAVAIYSKDQVTTIQVYFISAVDNGVVPTSLMNTEAKKQVRKAMINGQMVIVRDGKMFNALGTEL